MSNRLEMPNTGGLPAAALAAYQRKVPFSRGVPFSSYAPRRRTLPVLETILKKEA
jgi:hypothetical protein